jgi:hypothetical protein
MKKKVHIFYKVTYINDGRYYYGSHTGYLDDNYRGSNKVIRQIIKKYGLGVLKRENLKIFNTKDECFTFEDRFLKLYNLKDDPNSLNFKNSAKGGDTWSHMSDEEKIKRKEILSSKISGKGNGNYGKPMPEERKKKMIDSKKGVPVHSEENKKKISERLKSEWKEGKRKYNLKDYCNNRKGKKNSEEWNQNISEGIRNSESYKISRKIIGLKKIEEFNKKLAIVKNDIINGLSDQELMDKYNIKPITLYTWKKNIKNRNI